MSTAAPDETKNMDDFLDIEEKRTNDPGKSRNVNKIKKEVDELGFIVGRNKNTVYDIEGAEGRAPWEVGLGDGGGREEILQSPGLEEVPDRRDGGQDMGPVPLSRTTTEWAAGGAQTPGGASGWIPDGEVQTWTPAEETGPDLPSASGEMRWAEQADRAFRRDSRRYDGGFYLY